MNNLKKKLVKELIGEKIRKLIKLRGYSVTEFAYMINCSRRTMYEIFQKNSIDTDLLLRISAVLKVNLFEEFVKKADLEIHNSVQQNARRHDFMLDEPSNINFFRTTEIDKQDDIISIFTDLSKRDTSLNKKNISENFEEEQRKKRSQSQRIAKQKFEEKILEQLILLNQNYSKIIEILSEINRKLG